MVHPYGGDHQAERARRLRVLAASGPRPCRRCGRPMLHPDHCPRAHPRGPCFYCHLDLGHPAGSPVILGGTGHGRDLEHARCNRQAGARLGNRLRHHRTHTTRQW